jgi:hypothetical protein
VPNFDEAHSVSGYCAITKQEGPFECVVVQYAATPNTAADNHRAVVKRHDAAAKRRIPVCTVQMLTENESTTFE